MKPFWEKIERFNSRLILPAIIVLLGIIIVELFFHRENHPLNLIVQILDYMVIAVFVIDLIFLAIKARSTSFFFRHYWLDILAIFPFNLVFTAVNQIFKTISATEQLALGQSIIHESLEAEKEVAGISKGSKIARTLRFIVRPIRIITKSKLFTRFEAKHHEARRKTYHKKHSQRKK